MIFFKIVMMALIMKTSSLKAMVALGVPGFKCFLIHSGVDEFPAVTRDQVNVNK